MLAPGSKNNGFSLKTTIAVSQLPYAFSYILSKSVPQSSHTRSGHGSITSFDFGLTLGFERFLLAPAGFPLIGTFFLMNAVGPLGSLCALWVLVVASASVTFLRGAYISEVSATSTVEAFRLVGRTGTSST